MISLCSREVGTEKTRRWWLACPLGLLLLLSVASGAQAQLDQTCTVSALNRTAPVQPDGSWVLPNVPSTVGQLRVRATCVDGNGTRSGQSEFFALPTDGVLRVADILFNIPEPVPATLALTAASAVLTIPGETLDLAALVTLPDGSTRDVSAAATGTNYTISNPRIATITPDGRVTAVTSGTVLVSASNEGALGVLRLRVVLSGDSDGDGLPDDFEVAAGLDPNNPADAFADPDGDGLATGDEVAAGLDPIDPDSDDDGLRDGDEVNVYNTDPLLLDTDGDEVSDGLEVQSGSDPLDPASLNLGPILAGISAEPATVSLVFNLALGEASRRLDVRGQLIDGRTIDLRRRSRGTNYGSSNLAVASFGAEDGRVFAGQDGTAVVTVTNGAFSDTVQVSVTSFSPTALSFLAIPGYANGVDVSGNYVYVAAGAAGLVVVDAADLAAPRIAGIADTPGNANDVRVDGNGFAYVADGASGLTVVDVRDPEQPVIAGRRDTPGDATDVAVTGGLAYVADGPAGLQIVDVSDPSAPILMGGVDTPGNARGVDADGTLAVVADGSSGLQVIDVADPENPLLVGTTHTRPNFVSQAADVALRGRLAYVADGADFNMGGLRVIDLREPENPVVVGSSSDEFALAGVALDGPLALTADYFFVNSVPVFNVGGSAPVYSAQVDFSGAPSFRDDDGNGVAVQGGVVYMVGTSGIQDNGVSAYGGGLHIGRYLVQPDDLGVAPRVSIVSPEAGSTAPERASIVVRTDATDDFQVALVQFFLDGVPVSVDTRAPFEATVEVPAGVPSFTLGAVAIDYGGNRGEAEPVVVAIGPDTQPRVTLLAPVAGQRFVEGVVIDVAARATDDVRVEQVEFLIDGQPYDVRTFPPYRTSIQIPIGAEQLTVQAVATDSAGQTAATEVVVGVDDDPPPFVAVVAPAPGAEVVAGSRLLVGVGATDPQGVTVVLLAVDGVPYADDVEAPYQFSLFVPTAGTELVLTASAVDVLGQQTTVEARFPIVPDPGTTVEGRVVDAAGLGVAGAAVRCLGVSGVSGSGGFFSVADVPTVRGAVSCGAQVSGAGGETLEGASAAVPPVPGGTTQAGDVVVAPRILYLGSGNGPGELAPGRLLVLDDVNGRYVPWSAGLPPSGLSGLAFDGAGRLFATTLPPQGVPELTASPQRLAPKAFLGNGSRLLRLDPDTGAVVAEIGPVTAETGGPVDLTARRSRLRAASAEIGVQDLAYDPATDRFYALSEDSGKLYTVDPATGAATVFATGLSFGNATAAALALGPDGLLYVLFSLYNETPPASLVNAEAPSFLLKIVDPVLGAVVASDPVSGTLGASFTPQVGGMTLRPGTGTFLVTSYGSDKALYELDPLARAITPFSAPGGAVEGSLGALAYRPLAGTTAAVTTTVAGTVVDSEGAPVAGAAVSSLGAFGTTVPDGSFLLPDVRVRTGLVRAAVGSGSDLAFSTAVPPVPDGVTDLGTIVLGASVCLTGTLLDYACTPGPVTEPLNLYLEDDLGQLTLVDQIVPDATGRFCANLRPGRWYYARREDLECAACSLITACEVQLMVTDPGAAGICGGAGASCQDVGEMYMQCDFYCGS